jgi:hypothetical protein
MSKLNREMEVRCDSLTTEPEPVEQVNDQTRVNTATAESTTEAKPTPGDYNGAADLWRLKGIRVIPAYTTIKNAGYFGSNDNTKTYLWKYMTGGGREPTVSRMVWPP